MSATDDRAAAEPLLRVKDLVKHYPVKRRLLSREVERVHAVDGASFEINAGLGFATVLAETHQIRNNSAPAAFSKYSSTLNGAPT